MMRKIISLFLLSTAIGFAQTPAAPKVEPKPTEIQVQKSTAEDALLSIYADYLVSQKKSNDILQQARTELDKENKPTQDKINELQKAIDANNQKALQKYQSEVSPFNQKVSQGEAQIKALSDVVKKDQKLPDTAYFDLTKGTWLVPVTPESKVKN